MMFALPQNSAAFQWNTVWKVFRTHSHIRSLFAVMKLICKLFPDHLDPWELQISFAHFFILSVASFDQHQSMNLVKGLKENAYTT